MAQERVPLKEERGSKRLGGREVRRDRRRKMKEKGQLNGVGRKEGREGERK